MKRLFSHRLFRLILLCLIVVMGALPTLNPTPAQAQTGLRLQYRAADTNASDNQIKPHFNIVNGSSASVNMSELKIRYYFTKDAGGTTAFNCDWAIKGCGNISGAFLAGSGTNTDTILEVSFSAGAGSIAAGQSSGEMQLRLNKSDWTNFNESNDYSFDATKTAFADHTAVVLLQNGSVVWGTPPTGTAPTNTPGNPTAVPTRTNTPIGATATRTNTPQGPTATRTNTPVSSGDGSPYNGTPANLPGTVQAENFNTGGQNVAYNDTTTGNSGNQYRTSDNVDVETTTDTGGGYNVGWTVAGEWMKYTVNVTTSGSYTLTFRVAAQQAGGSFHLEVDGVNVTGAVAMPNTGGWQTWTNVTRTGINLTAGQHVLRLVVDGSNGNFNWFSVGTGNPPTNTPVTAPTRTNTPPSVPTRTNTRVSQPTNGHPIGGAFNDNLDTYDTGLWDKSDGWTNGNPFNNGWRAGNVIHSNGQVSLMLDNAGCPGQCSNKPYASGEYRTDRWYGYGRIEARFRAPRVNGTMAASLFTYSGPSDGDPWDEIDIEILGKNTSQMQTNYFTNGVGGHESIINLGFDASAGFHTYAFEWGPNYIRWYVDGTLVHTENGSRGALPTNVGKIMVNYWPGIGVDSWLGSFSYPGSPTYAVYDWIKYTPLN